MPPDIAKSKCAAGTLRRATRSVARLYDLHLAHAGLTTAQFSLLNTLDQHDGPMPLTQLAEEQVYERTSLYRALEPLCRDGLVTMIPGQGRNKQARLTARGARRVAQALPHWQEAQAAFLHEFGRTAWNTFAVQLETVVAAVRGISAPDGTDS
jgi:DNA-binding MarR family transcriptional regulator